MPLLRHKHPKTKNEKGKIKQAESLNLTKSSSKTSHKRFFQVVKGVSPRISSFGFLRASMTVEAALVLPLFLLFFLTLGGGLEILRFQSRFDEALWKVGREVCVYGTLLREGLDAQTIGNAQEESAAGKAGEMIGNLAFSLGYVRARLEDGLGSEYLSEAPIADGMSGLRFLQASILNPDDTVQIFVSYEARPHWKVPGFRTLRMENHYFGRLWTGYALSETENELFYLAENAEVFHRDVNCSHLKLQPYQTTSASLALAVNASGSHYRACGICAKGVLPDVIWISPEGDCHHYRRDCSGLKRTVRAVNWEEAKKYRACSRCGEWKGEE